MARRDGPKRERFGGQDFSGRTAWCSDASVTVICGSAWLLTPRSIFGAATQSIDWQEAGNQPLCLLSRHLHNRIIIDRIFASVGVTPKAVIETNCSLGLFAHMRSGSWLTIVPHSYFYLLGDWVFIRSIPIVNPASTATIGLVIHERDPISPAVRAFVEVAQQAGIGKQLDRYRS